ncbi:ABC transporter ATP-binding protein [Branchiibius sp. NY16-3462-2]|nr:ABC transporter ATP-binding protein [Branchiibius sp. NY16-3462-2]
MTLVTSAAVEIRDVVHSYGATRALDGLTWSAAAGRITCVLGPNGAGKTSIIEMAEGLRRPDSGSITVLGVNPWGADAQHRARVGVMLQDGGLPGSVAAGRFLTHLTRLYPDTGALPQLRDRLGLAAFEKTTVRRLSGGQRQRVALAAALLPRPEVAFLDEPSAGLDPHARLDVWDLVREERDRGCAVVVTTHSFEEAEQLADDIVIMAAGRVVAAGTPATVAAGASLADTYFELTRPVR